MLQYLSQIILVLICCTVGTMAGADNEQPGFGITVLVANRSGVSALAIAKMQSEAGWVLGKAGISTTWIDCPFSTEPAEANSPCAGPLGQTRFLVRLTRDPAAQHVTSWDMLGFSHVTPDGGSYATMLMNLVEKLAGHQQLVSTGQILGHAAAHEIGHLLMGSNSHSPHGLMSARWKANELRDMAARHLLFSKQEGQRMRIRIALHNHNAVQSP